VYALAGCVYVSQTGPGPSSEALPPLDDSRLSRLLHTDDGLGRAMVVEDASLALTSRLDLIEAAESSIDLQYFIWQNDPSGIFVIDRLLAAADRGVRVRALIDDVQLEGLVSRINAITKHPNIEVRIFNPFSVRFGMRLRLFRLAEFAIDGNRLNHRMHNKLLVADNQAAILGGRNIGDDYFGRSVKRNFIDTDILLSGSVVPHLSEGFDAYWNSGWAVPSDALLRLELFELDLEAVRARIRERLEEHPELDRLIDPERVEVLARSLLDGHRLEAAEPVLDDPDVGWGQLPDEVASALTELARCCDSEILIVSPYLVLTPALIEIGDELENRGVRVAVVTNSLESNDVVIAHAAYARFRGAVLDSGAALYEFRGDPAMARDDPAEDISLHSKYILFDDDTVFIGSPNLDPRSLRLNTELGVVLKSPSLVAELKETFTHLTSGENSWRVRRSEDGFEWESAKGTVYRQPAKSGWQRFRSWLLMLLPVTNQL
jgi:putative cardiolipin synthase